MRLLPEPKQMQDRNDYTKPFHSFYLNTQNNDRLDEKELLEIAGLRFANCRGIEFYAEGGQKDRIELEVVSSLAGVESEKPEMLLEQGYRLEISPEKVVLKYENLQGYVNALTTIKQLLEKEGDMYRLPAGEITDYPSIPVRAVAPTLSWYAGYGRIGFDMQLWGEKEWTDYLNACLDDKINQMNLVMYGYWPFEFEEYPETVFRDVPIEIWNKENRRFIKVKYSHPNIEDDFLERFIELAHKLGVKIFAYVGLNSYNGGYSIKHPEKRMKPPEGSGFLNDFDSVCLSDEDNIAYIIRSMEKITELGFDGFTLEESEEGFWFCECEKCRERWHAVSNSPGEAKHKANMWLLRKIYDAVRAINPDAVIGIRAFRQPPLEKDPAFLQECVDNMPDDIVLFWAPGLYVPPTEFKKWIAAFGKERIWGRDTESNSITSTMGRLYRTFESNVIRYPDEANEQVIERDIEMHMTSVEEDVHGINGFMFEWYGLFMHQWAHGNYGWGSRMDREEFFRLSCELHFGKELGEKVLYVLKNIVTIHESQIPLYTTPFPFQKNKMTDTDIPAIRAAIENHPNIMQKIEEILIAVEADERLNSFIPHFYRLQNAEMRNRVIYDMVLAALDYERETDAEKKDALLDKILYYNEKDFDLVKDMFFDVNPVGETGVKSCMIPYHELKRLVYNIRHPEHPDEAVICSGIEALGWLWL